jgi:hypothetical protein
MQIRLWIVVLFLLLTNIALNVSAETAAPLAQTPDKQSDSVIQNQAQDAAKAKEDNAEISDTDINAGLDNESLQNLPSDVRVLVDISGSMKTYVSLRWI